MFNIRGTPTQAEAKKLSREMCIKLLSAKPEKSKSWKRKEGR